MRALLCTCLLSAAFLPGCGDDSRSTARDRSAATSTPTPSRNLSTEFTMKLYGSWSEPSAALVEEFRSIYFQQTGQEAALRAIRADARGVNAWSMFVTVEP